jgi:hypothetical protein
MSKRNGPNCILVLLMLFAGAQATAQGLPPKSLVDSTVVVAGLVSSFDADLGLVTVDGVTVFVGDLVSTADAIPHPGDEILVVGSQSDPAGVLWAVAFEFSDRPSAQSITGTGKKSITGTGRQSITGTGKQSITGTGKQSITGTGKQSITGTGLSLQSITGTGKSAQSITGTGKTSITGTGSR